jgi:glycine/D-amino acid oxidase-like deaminating enzyme
MKTDVVVIGGGAIGAAVAYYLKSADPGIAVTVLERDPPDWRPRRGRRAGSGGCSRCRNIELSKYSIDFRPSDTMSADGVLAGSALRERLPVLVPPSDREVLKRNFDTQQRLGATQCLEPDELKQQFRR